MHIMHILFIMFSPCRIQLFKLFGYIEICYAREKMGELMLRIVMVSCLAVLVAGCVRQGPSSQTQYDSEGRVKPVAALVPVIDRLAGDLPWNLSDELTAAIYNRLALKNKVQLIDSRTVHSKVKKLGSAHNPFGEDLGWVRNVFNQEEFVIFLELVEHEEVPVSSEKTADPRDLPAELNISMRVRVLDLRSQEPKVVLQELIHDSRHIPKTFNRYNFYQVIWGKEGFGISPMGLAHARMTREIAARLEAYILFAK